MSVGARRRKMRKGFDPYNVKWTLQAGGDVFSRIVNRYLFSMSKSFEAWLEKDPDRLTQIVESLSVSFTLLVRARDAHDVYAAAVVLSQGLTRRSAASHVEKAIKSIFNCSARDFKQQSSDTLLEGLNWIRRHIDNAEKIKENPMSKKIQKVFMHCLALGIFDQVGLSMSDFRFSEGRELYFRSKYGSKMDFLWSLLDGTTFIAQRAVWAYRTGSWSVFLHDKSSHIEWATKCFKLKEDALKLHNPDAMGLNYHAYVKELNEAIEYGTDLLKLTSAIEKPTIMKMLLELKRLQIDEITKKATRCERRTPLGVLLAGNSGVMKSTLTKILFYHYGRVRNLPISEDYLYTRTIGEDFWSSFATHQWCIRIDDIANQNPNLGLDPSLESLLYIINNVPFTPPQAELELKGKTPLKAELVISTTNIKHLNAACYYENSLAVQRRFPFTVWVDIKKEYSVDGKGRMVDTTKIPEMPDDAYPNLWNFTVYDVVPREMNEQNAKQLCDLKVRKKFTDIYEFLSEYTKTVDMHNRSQDRAIQTDHLLKSMKTCSFCHLPEKHCRCRFETQALEYRPITWLSVMVSPVMWCFSFLCTFSWIMWLLYPLLKPRIADMSFEAVKSLIEKMHERLDAILPTRFKLCLIALATMVSALVLFKGGDIFKSYVGEEQATDMYEKKPPPLSTPLQQRLPSVKDEKENVWKKDNFVPTSLELTRHTRSWKNLPKEQVVSCMLNNVRSVEVTFEINGKTLVRAFTMLGVGGHLYVMNNHSLPCVEQMSLKVISQPDSMGVSPNFETLVYDADILRQPDKDLAWIELRCCPPVRNISKLFLNRPLREFRHSGSMILRRSECEVVPLSRIDYRMVPTPNLGDYSAYTAVSPVLTKKGDCGSPYIGWHPQGPVVLGIHSLGNDENAVVAYPIIASDIRSAMDHFHSVFVEQSSPDLEDRQCQPVELLDLHHKSVFRYIEKGTVCVYGSMPGFRQRHTSEVKDSMIAADMRELGFETDFQRPIMSGWEVWRNAALPVVQQFYGVRASILRKCVESYATDIIEGVGPDVLHQELFLLDDRAVVNGYPGTRFIDAMNLQTSMGFPWKCSKEQYIRQIEPQEPWNVMYTFSDEVWERVHRIQEAYVRGERACPVFTAHLKDEPVKSKKVVENKTRVFSGAPVDWVIVVRRILLPFARVFQVHNFTTEGAVGANPFSDDWDNFFHYLTDFGDHQIVAGDFSNFDKRMQSTFILAAFDVIAEIYKAAGWGAEVRMIHCIAEDIAFAFTDFNGDIVQFFGSNPSGHSLTVIVNSMVNSLYMRYCYTQILDLSPSTFQENVHLLTYGDDNIMGIHKGISDRFNHCSIAHMLSTIGVIYTMADKERESVPLVPIWETTFLKRSWRYSPVFERIVAPLCEESNIKTLMKCIESKTIHPKERMAAAMMSVLMESFNYGCEKFEWYKSLLDWLAERHGLVEYGFRKWSWFELYTKFNLEDHRCPCYFDSWRYETPEYEQYINSVEGVSSTVLAKSAKPTKRVCEQLLLEGSDRTDERMGSDTNST